MVAGGNAVSCPADLTVEQKTCKNSGQPLFALIQRPIVGSPCWDDFRTAISNLIPASIGKRTGPIAFQGQLINLNG